MGEEKIVTTGDEPLRVVEKDGEFWIMQEYAHSPREPKGWMLMVDVDRVNAIRLRDALARAIGEG